MQALFFVLKIPFLYDIICYRKGGDFYAMDLA